MSGKTNIDKVALDFITVYKKLKDKNLRPGRFRRRGEELLEIIPGRRGRPDKINK